MSKTNLVIQVFKQVYNEGIESNLVENLEHYETPEKAFEAIECLISKSSSIKTMTVEVKNDCCYITLNVNSSWNPILFTEKRYKTMIDNYDYIKRKISSKLYGISLSSFCEYVYKLSNSLDVKATTESRDDTLFKIKQRMALLGNFYGVK